MTTFFRTQIYVTELCYFKFLSGETVESFRTLVKITHLDARK